MNEFEPVQLVDNPMLHWVANVSKENAAQGGHDVAKQAANEATPQQIGDIVAKYAHLSDEANADAPTFIDKLRTKSPELFLLVLSAIGVTAATVQFLNNR